MIKKIFICCMSLMILLIGNNAYADSLEEIDDEIIITEISKSQAPSEFFENPDDTLGITTYSTSKPKLYGLLNC